MVQVDVFWAYAYGAGFSIAAFRQLKKMAEDTAVPQEKEPEVKRKSLYDNMYFVKALLYITVLFVPSGAYLLWAFPSWETMHVGTYETIPAWIVALFVMTIPLMFMLGFWVTYKLFMAEKYYAAGLQPFIGYFLMFFILVNGWDKTGYQRFFSATREEYLNWPSGFSEQLSAVANWLTSDVALTLYAMGVVLIPVLLYMLAKWLHEGYKMADNLDTARYEKVTPVLTIILLLLAVFGGSLGHAVIAAVLIANIGWVPGLLIFIIVAYFLGIKLFFPFIYRWILLVDETTH